ncbi:hypothetical protein P9761_20560 [Brevibacillus centrosporus]|uniref:hypothetical protein n=1 Tax=Brevibacillus centrosporus TaxID=54910 RepID=UPI000F09D417|nr:hypothetical protein [Brevibacillus centrosporus]MEC2128898.1 hypothetical protein [Brevibacillus centrosporus]MED4910580.1 hypothetical protein [Brevibacillus centrosporus]RNB70240.1 hypothetical protein EDM55_12295 [Brevibacillus centrosporus]GED34979.1 hypothetical protein BCE02nite_61200 [Brevibacillus centrosporus]
MKLMLIPLILIFLMDSNSFNSYHHAVTQEELSKYNEFTGECGLLVDEYDPELMWNNIKYLKNYESDTKGLERGKKIGEVLFKMNGNVCLGYKRKHGDATWAEIGTPIYQVKGYTEKFRIFVGDDLYEALENPYAKKIGDIFDISGKIKKITIEYPIENSPSVEFPEEATKKFIDEFLNLEYVPFKDIYKTSMFRSEKYFLRFQLHDDSSFIVSFWPDENVFIQGHGNDVTKKIIMSHAEKLTTKYPRFYN